MTSNLRHGPGPIIQGQDITNPERFIVQQPGDGTVRIMTQQEIAAIPIAPQWFSGTANGLLATWWSREVAEQHANQIGVIFGQIKPWTVNGGKAPVLCDASGNPLRCE